MILLKFHENNIITEQIHGATQLDGSNSKLIPNAVINSYLGKDIRTVNDDGSIMVISQQITNGYYTLKEDEKLEGETIVKKSLEELQKEYPDKYPLPKEPTKFDLLNRELESIIQDYSTKKQRLLATQEILGIEDNTALETLTANYKKLIKANNTKRKNTFKQK